MEDPPTLDVCCLGACAEAGPAALRLDVSPPPDGGVVTLWAHLRCFTDATHVDALPDDPRDHGRIPGAAACAFCGQRLPVVGPHPYAFDVGDHVPPHRYWAHASCLHDGLSPEAQAAFEAEAPDEE